MRSTNASDVDAADAIFNPRGCPVGRMKAGDSVELRSPAEIRATLDDEGCLDGLPFMPEMLHYFGRKATVRARLDRPCDTIDYHGVRKISDAVLLDDWRCDGSGHRGCGAQCRIYWKEAWLRPVSPDQVQEAPVRDEAYSELERLANENTTREALPTDDPTYRCHATELLRASTYVPWWSPRSLVGELTSGNVGITKFATTIMRMFWFETVRRLGVVRHSPFKPSGRPVESFPMARPLQVGELVRVRSRAEISRTIDERGGNRGLWFDREQLLHCGKVARVDAKVTQFVDERTGKFIELSSDCFILEGMVCTGVRSQCRWFCPRGVSAWWRETWLERVDEEAVATPAVSARPSST